MERTIAREYVEAIREYDEVQRESQRERNEARRTAAGQTLVFTSETFDVELWPANNRIRHELGGRWCGLKKGWWIRPDERDAAEEICVESAAAIRAGARSVAPPPTVYVDEDPDR